MSRPGAAIGQRRVPYRPHRRLDLKHFRRPHGGEVRKRCGLTCVESPRRVARGEARARPKRTGPVAVVEESPFDAGENVAESGRPLWVGARGKNDVVVGAKLKVDAVDESVAQLRCKL